MTEPLIAQKERGITSEPADQILYSYFPKNQLDLVQEMLDNAREQPKTIKVRGKTKKSKYIDNLHSVIQRPEQSFSLHKGGSELFFLGREKLGIIINKGRLLPFYIWRSLVSGVIHYPSNGNFDGALPVAPILVDKRHHRLRYYTNLKNILTPTTVVSRFCGLTEDFLRKKLRQVSLDHPSLADKTERLLIQIDSQTGRKSPYSYDSDVAAFLNLPIDHGHPHQDNVTVEFVRKSYWQSNRGKYTINTLPYSPKDFSINPTDYLTDPDNWLVVCRFIDFDSASIRKGFLMQAITGVIDKINENSPLASDEAISFVSFLLHAKELGEDEHYFYYDVKKFFPDFENSPDIRLKLLHQGILLFQYREDHQFNLSHPEIKSHVKKLEKEIGKLKVTLLCNKQEKTTV